jgi:ABC-2 type transport system permease protein
MKVLRIIVKDLKIVLSDRQALIITLLMPLVLMTILSMALKGSFMSSDDTGMEKIPVALVKQYDKGADSEIFVKTLEERLKINISGDEVNPEEMFFDDFLGNPEVSKLIDYRVEEENRAKDLLNEGEISAL